MTWTCDQIDWNAAAAWVQAVGSVAAIFAAIAISYVQAGLAEAVRRQDKVDLVADHLWSATAYLREGQRLLSEAQAALTDPRTTSAYFHDSYREWFFDHIRAGLAAFPLFQAGNGAFTAAYLRCFENYVAAASLLGKVKLDARGRFFGEQVQELGRLIEDLNAAVGDLIDEIHVVESYRSQRAR